MAGVVPPPTALMPHRVVLSTKLAAGYPQLSLDPEAAGTVMPGVHDGAPVGAPHVPPTVPPEDEQSGPLQQRFGLGDIWGVHVRPGSQPPVESQRQPWVPTMHVVGAPEEAPGPPSPFPPSEVPPWCPPQPAATKRNATTRWRMRTSVAPSFESYQSCRPLRVNTHSARL